MALSLQERQEFLAEPQVAALSVCDPSGSGPLTVPIWFQYAPGQQAWVLTPANSRKVGLIAAAGRFTLMVQRTEPTVRYVSVEGPVTRMLPGTDEQLREISNRYLLPDAAANYAEFARTHLSEQTAIFLQPERWHSADLGSWS